ADARTLYHEAVVLLDAGDLPGALERLERSDALQASPNTELLMGHALRRLARRADAMRAYEKVIVMAGQRVREGADRYSATLDEAGRWTVRLRLELAELRIVVRGASDATRVMIDGRAPPAALDRAARSLTLTQWHEPGAVVVRAVEPGRER